MLACFLFDVIKITIEVDRLETSRWNYCTGAFNRDGIEGAGRNLESNCLGLSSAAWIDCLILQITELVFVALLGKILLQITSLPLVVCNN